MGTKLFSTFGRLTQIGLVAALLIASGGPPPGAAQTDLPEPHLFYGMNVFAEPSHAETESWGWQTWMPDGFQWIKVWEQYQVDVADLQYEGMPYRVLYTLDVQSLPEDLEAWGDHVTAIATEGKGLIEAYEVGNEPNTFWQPSPYPDEYFEVLKEAYTRIKAVDPEAFVVVAGLAPVGRIRGTCHGYDGNNCSAMDELKFWRAMFELGAGEYFDVFGIHPYGFAYAPETDPYSVSNNFCFRGAELQYAVLQEYGYGDKPVWATEFSWLRAASEDGEYPAWCWNYPEYRNYVGWIEVTEEQQADYIVRAFQYADENWPWMHGLFLWNLDWYDHGWLCEAARYYSIMRVEYNGTWNYDQEDHTYHPGFSEAHEAVGEMEKRPAEPRPRLRVTPSEFILTSAVSETLTFTLSAAVDNPWYYSFESWKATADASGTVSPTLITSTGAEGESLRFTVSSSGYPTGTFTGGITVTATLSDTFDSPQYVPVTLYVWPEINRVYLPLTSKDH